MILRRVLLFKGKKDSVVRYFCKSSNKMKEDIKKSVYISQSTDIYTNLALEDWLYKNSDFTRKQILLLWQNEPCVVIGRHQNPWLEANVEKLDEITSGGVKLARRNSGGGTVYHDEGNLNITFFTTKEQYNRKQNLQIITKAIFREYGLKIDISSREDLTIRNNKVSGTAAKLGRPNAYHHCTLLVNANKKHLKEALLKTSEVIETNATRSIRSQIMNLHEENGKISIGTLIKAIGNEYLNNPKRRVDNVNSGGFQLVNPTELWFPGIEEIRHNLTTWEWIFERTPKFTVVRSVDISELDCESKETSLKIIVDKGRINNVVLDSFPNLEQAAFIEEKVLSSVKNSVYSQNCLNNIVELTGNLLIGKVPKERVKA